MQTTDTYLQHIDNQIEQMATVLNRLEAQNSGKHPSQPQITIMCIIGNRRFERAMLDLGAFINVMPYSIYASLNLGPLEETGIIIQSADRSTTRPIGVVEDVIVQVNQLIFLADFYVLEMEADSSLSTTPIYLADRS